MVVGGGGWRAVVVVYMKARRKGKHEAATKIGGSDAKFDVRRSKSNSHTEKVHTRVLK